MCLAGFFESVFTTFFCPLQEFDDYRDADDAIADLNGKELLGERCGFSSYKALHVKH